jgi:hypothetical protein
MQALSRTTGMQCECLTRERASSLTARAHAILPCVYMQVVPAGAFRTLPFNLTSGMTLFLEKGAYIYGPTLCVHPSRFSAPCLSSLVPHPHVLLCRCARETHRRHLCTNVLCTTCPHSRARCNTARSLGLIARYVTDMTSTRATHLPMSQLISSHMYVDRAHIQACSAF